MKTAKKLMLFAVLILVLFAIVGCEKNNSTTESTDSENKQESTIDVASSSNELIKPTVPTGRIMTIEEAYEFYTYWLSSHPDLELDNSITFDPTNPENPEYPNFLLFGNEYYEFIMSYENKGYKIYYHSILVNAETGELLSQFRTWNEDNFLSETIIDAEDWYNQKSIPLKPATISPEVARDSYNTWLESKADILGETLYYEISDSLGGTIHILGKNYYYYTNDYNYWYNILIDNSTGEIYNMLTSDGLYPITNIVPIEEWISAYFG